MADLRQGDRHDQEQGAAHTGPQQEHAEQQAGKSTDGYGTHDADDRAHGRVEMLRGEAVRVAAQPEERGVSEARQARLAPEKTEAECEHAKHQPIADHSQPVVGTPRRINRHQGDKRHEYEQPRARVLERGHDVPLCACQARPHDHPGARPAGRSLTTRMASSSTNACGNAPPNWTLKAVSKPPINVLPVTTPSMDPMPPTITTKNDLMR